ncbi:MAG TPA: hypothetical protein VF111_09170 [Thermoanaerobaculia bacterium]
MKTASVFAAAALFAAAPLFADWDFEECKYKEARNLTTPSAGVTRVIIHGESGSLTVEGRQNVAQVTVMGQACTSDDEFLPRMTLIARKVGGDLHITADIPEKTVIFGFFQARIDFSVILPAGLPVEIDDGSGWIKISNTGATSIDDGSGSIDARNIRGELKINDGSGEIDVRDVVGSVEIEDNSGEIDIRNITGNVEIEDGSGAISVREVSGLVRIPDDGSGSITIENVKRDVLIREDGSGSISVADIGGDFRVDRKGSGGIDYDRVAGKVSVPSRDRRRD